MLSYLRARWLEHGKALPVKIGLAAGGCATGAMVDLDEHGIIFVEKGEDEASAIPWAALAHVTIDGA